MNVGVNYLAEIYIFASMKDKRTSVSLILEIWGWEEWDPPYVLYFESLIWISKLI